MGRQTARASELRAAIDRLPLATRRAMLDGIEGSSIIVGADGDPRGGVCPVYAISSPPSKRVGRPFARAWDRYARVRLSRPASERELRTLRSMLETSIELETEPAVSLREGIAGHRASRARSRVASPAEEPQGSRAPLNSGEHDRTDELSQHEGWAWLRPFRRYDDYARALQALDDMAREAGSEPVLERFASSSSGRG